MERMSRQQFFAATAGLGEEQLRKALWNLYWRGAAPVRARIEAELAPRDRRPATRVAAPPVDPDAILDDVRDFISLARSGAYLAGDRRVKPTERTRWRFTFRRLVAESRQALLADDIAPGAEAMAAIIDLACELRDYDYFRSEDPVEAAGLVVSDQVALLWGRTLERSGLPVFARQAAGQLVRWESRYGWTRAGFGKVSQKETSLAAVLAGMLPHPDAWVTVGGCYLTALDGVASATATSTSSRHPGHLRRDQRTAALATWHLMLLDRFLDSDAEDLLDRLAAHPGLGGPELTFFQSRLAFRRGEPDRARNLVRDSLTMLPGHQGFLDFAREIGAPLPPHTQRIADERGRNHP